MAMFRDLLRMEGNYLVVSEVSEGNFKFRLRGDYVKSRDLPALDEEFHNLVQETVGKLASRGKVPLDKVEDTVASRTNRNVFYDDDDYDRGEDSDEDADVPF